MLIENITKYRKNILLLIGTLLLIVSVCLIGYDKVELLKKSVFDEVELEKYREKNKDSDNKIVDNREEDVSINNIETQEVGEEENTSNNNSSNSSNSSNTNTNTNKNNIQKEFIGYLEIKKINLKQGLVGKNSYYNNVNRNIQILAVSDYPDKDKGNTILAAHSGTSSISYFKNLYKLVLGDEAKIYYKDKIYTYKIVDIYNVPKTGSLTVKRDTKKTSLTLITCTHNSNTEQTVYILELTSKESEV